MKGFVESESQKQAREIMGENFLGVKEVCDCFGQELTLDLLEKMAFVPYIRKTLRKYAKTHILFPYIGLSVREMYATIDNRELFRGWRDPWFCGADFCTEFGSAIPFWLLIEKDISTVVARPEEVFIGKDDYETKYVPTTHVMTCLILSNFLIRGERLFKYVYVDTRQKGCRDDVGCGMFYKSLDFDYECSEGLLGKVKVVPYDNKT